MKLSLRVRVLLIVTAINLLVYGIGSLVVLRDADVRVEKEYSRAVDEYARTLFDRLQSTVGTEGEINVGTILGWPVWGYLDDALIVHKSLDTDAAGHIRPGGAWLNPLGRERRPPLFPEQEVLVDIARAIERGTALPSHGGTVIPILDRRGNMWGGCWFALAPFQRPIDLPILLLPWFVISTILITLTTFWLLRRSVLDPVQQLAEGAHRLARGDLAARVHDTGRDDELSGLIRNFNAMASEVEGYNARLAHDVEEATEKARRAEAAVMTQRRLAATGELAAGIAHEINNPLGGLINAVDALEKGDIAPDKRAQYHRLLRNGLERIRLTVGQLLRFTPRSAKPVSVALVEISTDAIALVQHRAQGLGVRVELSALDGPEGESSAERAERLRRLPYVLGEPHELGQAVLNLLVNALDALEERGRGGRVDVRIGARGAELILVVEDDGPGVSAADLPRVADLFFTTKEVGKGSGLGLAIVHNVVHKHGGRVQLSSSPGHGFKVEITLPARAEDPKP